MSDRSSKIQIENTDEETIDPAIEGNQSPPGTSPVVYNVTITNLDTEYSQALPASTKAFTMQCRTDYDVRFAYVTGKVATPTAPYMTLKSGQNYFEDRLNLTSKTIYLACGTANQVMEIVCYT